jgi:hypothetical protein
MWKVVDLEPYRNWFTDLDEDGKEDVLAGIYLLQEHGPTLGRPFADTLSGSAHPNMKELRVQSNRRPLRVLFAFDPRRNAVLLIGGDKTGDKRFYRRLIPLADELFSRYLEESAE